MDHANELRGSGRGFSGLAALASTISPAPTLPPEVQPVKPPAPSVRPQPEAAPSKPSGIGNKLWLAGIAVAVVYGIVSSQGSRTPITSSAPAPTSQPRPSPSTPSYTAPTYVAAESRPAGGAGNILSQGELRYCLTEKIRLEAMNDLVQDGTSNQIRRFNEQVDDYNSRCVRYRYREADMSSVRSAVDRDRAAIQGTARALLFSWR